MDAYEATYDFNNSSYNITDTAEVHELLRNDPCFFMEYISRNTTAPELASVSPHNYTEKEDNFNWSTKATKLMLHSYADRKEKFRNPKIKKKELWASIAEIMKKNGYENINPDILDRKMRNLKRSYKTLKDNNKKTSTGRGRVSWQYFDIFEEIFANDLTINYKPALQSAISNAVPSRSDHPISEDTEMIMNSRMENSSSDGCEIVDSLASPNFQSTVASPNFQSTVASPLSSPLAESCRNEATSSKQSNSKSLYNLRKKQVAVDEKRVEAINKLRESLEESNRIQQERNDILKQSLLRPCNCNCTRLENQ